MTKKPQTKKHQDGDAQKAPPHEKPVSLSPLTFEEALDGLLRVDPKKPDEKTEDEEKEKPDSE